MRVPFGDWKRQATALGPQLSEAATRVLASGRYLLGPEVQAFEAAFASCCASRHAIGVANGTEALQLALAALAIGPGSEVITVANAGVPGVAAILQAGATPVFVDVDETSQTMDPALLAAAITARTGAIMPVHLYGRMADMDAILAIAERHGIPVIEDAAQAHGATLGGRAAGSLGICGCFSFYPSKNLGAIGDGGAIVTSDDDLALRLRRLREYGWERKYYSTLPGGINSRLDEIQAACLLVKLPHLATWNAMRRDWASLYAQHLTHTELILPEIDAGHVCHLYVVRSRHRDELRAALEARGITTDIHYPLPAHCQPIYTHLAPPGGLPVTEQLAHEVLSLPIFPELTRDEVMAVIAALQAALAA